MSLSDIFARFTSKDWIRVPAVLYVPGSLERGTGLTDRLGSRGIPGWGIDIMCMRKKAVARVAAFACRKCGVSCDKKKKLCKPTRNK